MTKGYIYVYHFDEPLSHAQHYVGSTVSPLARAARHAEGHGARITQVLSELAKTWRIAAVYSLKENCPLTLREVELLAKARHNGGHFCPICTGGTVDHPPTWTQQVPIPQLTSKEVISYAKD